PSAAWRVGRLWLAFGILLASLSLSLPPSRNPAGPPAALAAELPRQPLVYVVRVYFTSLAQRDQLAATLDAQESSTRGGYLTAIVAEAQYQALLASGTRVEVDQSRTNLLNALAGPTAPQTSGIPGYPCYRTVEETYAALFGLAASHPGLATWSTVG